MSGTKTSGSTTAGIAHGDRFQVVRGLFEPRPPVYWLDFGLSALIGWVSFAVAVSADRLTLTVAAGALAALGLYRAVLFTHELVHLGRNRMRAFRLAWDAICGIPLLVPSFLYDGVHQEHHFRRRYGTRADGEYLPFGTPPRIRIVAYLLSHLILPPLMVLRFGLAGPLSWLSARGRRLVWKKMSSLSIDPGYERMVPERIPVAWVVQESLCAAYVWSVAALLYAQILPAAFPLTLYALSVVILVLNAVRTLAAHRYASRGDVMSFEEQLADSVNVTAGLVTPLLAPVGLRYHALHHLFPTMPYHNLGRAHRRLLERLPEDAVYRSTMDRSIWQALRELWTASGQQGVGSTVRSA
jgi:fatty acid desaturase